MKRKVKLSFLLVIAVCFVLSSCSHIDSFFIEAIGEWTLESAYVDVSHEISFNGKKYNDAKLTVNENSTFELKAAEDVYTGSCRCSDASAGSKIYEFVFDDGKKMYAVTGKVYRKGSPAEDTLILSRETQAINFFRQQ